MAKKKPDANGSESAAPASVGNILRAPAEVMYAEELEQLARTDTHAKPPGGGCRRGPCDLHLRRQGRGR